MVGFVCSEKSHLQVPWVTIWLHFFCPIQQACDASLEPLQNDSFSYTHWFILSLLPGLGGFSPHTSTYMHSVVGTVISAGPWAYREWVSPSSSSWSGPGDWVSLQHSGIWSVVSGAGAKHRVDAEVPPSSHCVTEQGWQQSLWTTQASCDWEASYMAFKFIASSEKCLKIPITVKTPNTRDMTQ